MLPAQLQQLFHPNPGQWGLRGDPYLWQELEHVFATLQIPRNLDSVEALLQCLYVNLVGESPLPGSRPFIARYEGGGMSSGYISADFWLEVGFPLLKSRIAEIVAYQHNVDS